MTGQPNTRRAVDDDKVASVLFGEEAALLPDQVTSLPEFSLPANNSA
jgi:hypothetical protein